MACGVAARRRAPLLAAALVFAALTVMEQFGALEYVAGRALRLGLHRVLLRSAPTSRAAGLRSGPRGWSRSSRSWPARPTADDGLNLVWDGSSSSRRRCSRALLHDRARLARSLRAAAGEDDGGPWAAQAVAEERSRIAADLHDVVARAHGADGRRRRQRRALVDDPLRAFASFGRSVVMFFEIKCSVSSPNSPAIC